MSKINELFFSLDLPYEWIMDFDSATKLYSFYSIDKNALGALQLTVFSSNEHHWYPQDWLKEFNDAMIKEVSDYQSVYFIEKKSENNSIIYHWIIGFDSRMIHITYTVVLNSSYENEFEIVNKIVNTLIIK